MLASYRVHEMRVTRCANAGPVSLAHKGLPLPHCMQDILPSNLRKNFSYLAFWPCSMTELVWDGKDKLKIISIAPQMPEKAAYDLSLPRLTPVLVRKKSLQQEIEGLDITSFSFSPDPLPRKPSNADIKK